jgi:hypothetical protein
MTNPELQTTPLQETLLSDEQVANLLKFSVAWLRKQRYLKRKGKPHILTVDPVMIGGTPRYRLSDIGTWLSSL